MKNIEEDLVIHGNGWLRKGGSKGCCVFQDTLEGTYKIGTGLSYVGVEGKGEMGYRKHFL